jgi:hypothetical protein
MVMAIHTSNTTFAIGDQGVDGFLIMSGWLNAMSLDRGLDH